MSAPPAPPGTTRAERGKWVLLFVLSGNMVLDSIEGSVLLLAMPAIGRQLGVPLATTQWMLSGFAFGFAAFIVLGPALTARWGRRAIYLGAMLAFTVASVAGGVVENTAVLIAARVVKGCCVALTAPAGLALISTAFPDGPRQRRAVTIYSLFGASGFTIGLLLSGSFAEWDWRWTFLAPAAVALVLLLVAPKVIPSAPAPRLPRLTAAVLRDGSLMRSTLGAATLNGAYIGLLLLISIQLSERYEWPSWQIAVALLPACVPLVISVPFAGGLVRRFGTVRLIAIGAGAAVLGDLLYLWRPVPAPYPAGLLPVLLLIETGLVLSFAALNMQSTSTIEPRLRPVAVACYQTGVQLGAGVLLAVTGILLSAAGSYRPALLVIAAAGALGCGIAVAGLRKNLPEREFHS
ncbi:MFS transporter [Nocardia goodfellowii]|uniref:MFS family permease n=1 Tax=Nocardia goodfellowii TaxID=882446 RepID=A0ABS4QHG1_9NOCA|nr:MFS transporter [Nocardia goodfellowii]MBP2191136.1 MFS family permease [Nocardia goodfellowii]